MILLPCPWCGPRDAGEFAHLGEAVKRPDPRTTTPQEWRAYLYLRDNPRGWTAETWYHRMGCRRYIKIERHTETNETRATNEPRASSETWVTSETGVSDETRASSKTRGGAR